MLKRYDDFGKVNENNNSPVEVVKNVISKWLGDAQKAEVVNSKFQRFIDSPKYKEMRRAPFSQIVWYFLLGNFFTKSDIESNSLRKEFNEILNSTNRSIFEYIPQTEESFKKMILSLFGNANAALQSLKKGDYEKAREYVERIFKQFMENSGFFSGRGKDRSIFTDESISRMKSFINLLASPAVSSTITSSGKNQSVVSRSPRKMASGESTEKLDNAVKKLVDTF